MAGLARKLKILIGLGENDGMLPSAKRIANDLEAYAAENDIDFKVRSTMVMIGTITASCDVQAYVLLFGSEEVVQQLLHDQLEMPEALAGIQGQINSVELVRGAEIR